MPDFVAPYANVQEPNYSSPGNGGGVPASFLRGLVVDQQLPPLSVLAARGWLHVASAGVVANASAVGADVATTAAQYALYNGNEAGQGGYSLHVLHIGSWFASGTAGLGATLMGGLPGVVQAAAVANMTGASIKCTSGAPSRASQATLGVTVTLDGAAAWHAWASVAQVSAVQVGNGPSAWVNGAIIVPPKYAYGLNMLSPAGTTSKWGVSVLYAEIPTYRS